MPKSRINKAFMQDWAQINQMSDVRELRALTQAQQSVLVAMCEYLNWKTRWQNPPDQDTLDAFSADTRTNIMAGICNELIDCLEPLFAELNAKLDAIQATATEINETTTIINSQQTANRANQPDAIEAVALSAVYGGALALVNQMHENNLKYYAEAELSAVDNAQEALDIVLNLFPRFQDQTYEEAFALGNAYFENQVIAYEAAYEDFELPAACDLYCRIVTNANTFDIDVWGAWLNALDTLIPDNAAAKVFAKFSPLRQTFLNQIAALFNSEISLQQYFKDLYIAYYAGTQDPVAVPPECDCVNQYQHTWDLDVEQGNWTFPGYPSPVTTQVYGQWLLGQGSQAQYRVWTDNSTLGQLYTRIVVPSATVVTKIVITGSWTQSTIQGTGQDTILKNTTIIHQQAPSVKGSPVTNGSITVEFPTGVVFAAMDTLTIQLIYRRTFTNTANSGFLTITKIDVFGDGDDPF